MKVMILTDLEGCAGTEGTKREGMPGNSAFTTPAMIKSLTNEINACAEGLFAAGAKEVLVWDSHGGGRNFSIDSLLPGITMAMMQDPFGSVCHLDASFDAAVQIGCHSRQGVINGYLNHTRNSSEVAEITINGKPIGEAEFAILRAGFFNVPHILVAGEYSAVRSALEFNGEPLETVVCKRGYSRYSVLHRPPEEVCREIRFKSERGLKNLEKFRVKKIDEPITVTLTVMCPNQLEKYILRGCEQIGDTTVRMSETDAIDALAQMCNFSAGVHNKIFGIDNTTANII
ncbi:MAG: M55 family metallopeptidase [Eubacteriales bacterium]|nr:M55 family metallopeptidase [Eubacteriales bacterium]